MRKKPKAVRKSYAFWGAVLLTMLLSSIWLLSLSVRFQDLGNEAVDEDTQSGAYSQFFDEARGNFLEVFNQFETEDEAPEVATSSSRVESEVAATSSQTVETGGNRRQVLIATSSAEVR